MCTHADRCWSILLTLTAQPLGTEAHAAASCLVGLHVGPGRPASMKAQSVHENILATVVHPSTALIRSMCVCSAL